MSGMDQLMDVLQRLGPKRWGVFAIWRNGRAQVSNCSSESQALKTEKKLARSGAVLTLVGPVQELEELLNRRKAA